MKIIDKIDIMLNEVKDPIFIKIVDKPGILKVDYNLKEKKYIIKILNKKRVQIEK